MTSLKSTAFVIDGRPVVVTDEYYEDRNEHGYEYQFIDDPKPRWVMTGNPRCQTANQYEIWMGG